MLNRFKDFWVKFIRTAGLADYITLFSAVITIISAIYFYLSDSTKQQDITKNLAQELIQLQFKQQELIDQQKEFQFRIDILRAERIDNIEDKILYSKLETLARSNDSLNIRFGRIEKIINQDPLKSLEMTLLKKDMESNKISIDSEFSHIKSDIDRTNNLIFASLFAIVVGVLSQFLSNVGKRPEKKNDQA